MEPVFTVGFDISEGNDISVATIFQLDGDSWLVRGIILGAEADKLYKTFNVYQDQARDYYDLSTNFLTISHQKQSL